MLKTQLDCENKEFQNLTIDPEQELWHIFHRQKISISGDEYICKRFLIRAVTNTFFFGHDVLQLQNWALPITPQQCRVGSK